MGGVRVRKWEGLGLGGLVWSSVEGEEEMGEKLRSEVKDRTLEVEALSGAFTLPHLSGRAVHSIPCQTPQHPKVKVRSEGMERSIVLGDEELVF